MKFPEQFRWKNPPARQYVTVVGDPFGAFIIPSHHAVRRTLKVMACDGTETGWEHVSVSLAESDKCPSWEEMCLVKSLFWNADECVVQFHPAEKEYVNQHTGCLHLWRCVNQAFPTPDKIMV